MNETALHLRIQIVAMKRILEEWGVDCDEHRDSTPPKEKPTKCWFAIM
jgi:hypothetical protein